MISKRRRKLTLKKLAVGIGVLLNTFFLVVCFTPLTESLYKPLIVNDAPPGKNQVIVILSAGMYENGFPDFRTLTRMKRGVELYEQKVADVIICAGGTRVSGSGKSIAEVMRESLAGYGIPGDRMFVVDEAYGTYRDISYTLKKFGKEFDFNRSVFVTSSYHTYRVKAILLKKGLRARVVSAEPYELHPMTWSERLDLFREIVREYAAVGYSKMKGWI